MPRGRPKKVISYNDLQRMMGEYRQRKTKLAAERKRIAKRLDAIDRELANLDSGASNGSPRASAGRKRPRNEAKLPDVIEQVMREGKTPMRVPEVVSAVQKAGYKSSSANFRNVVNQTLIKESRFTTESRGLYKLA